MDQDLSKIKVPPEGMVMPHIPELIFTILLHIPVVVFTLLGIYNLIKKKSPTLLYFIIGGYICAFLEPIVDVNGMCYFPMEGQIPGLYAYDRGIPLFVVGTYSWFMGGQGYLFKHAMDSGRMTKSKLWIGWASTILVNLIIEVPMLAVGLYIYYGPHPFKFFGFPAFWGIVNTMIPLSSGFAVHILTPYLTGWKSLLTIPIVPIADGFANLALGWPMWFALNSNYNFAATYPAFFLTLGNVVLTIWLISQLLPSTVDRKNTGPERQPLLA